MKAVSLRQPFATCILDGGKDGENRSRKMGFRAGHWYWLHASGGLYWPKKHWAEGVALIREVWAHIPEDVAAYPRASIVGAFLAGDTYRTDDDHPSPWVSGPWVTDIKAVVALSTPLEVAGKLGLWLPSRRDHVWCGIKVHQADLSHLSNEHLESLRVALGFGPDSIACELCGSSYLEFDTKFPLHCRCCATLGKG